MTEIFKKRSGLYIFCFFLENICWRSRQVRLTGDKRNTTEDKRGLSLEYQLEKIQANISIRASLTMLQFYILFILKIYFNSRHTLMILNWSMKGFCFVMRQNFITRLYQAWRQRIYNFQYPVLALQLTNMVRPKNIYIIYSDFVSISFDLHPP